jgi:hypothetical protein
VKGAERKPVRFHVGSVLLSPPDVGGVEPHGGMVHLQVESANGAAVLVREEHLRPERRVPAGPEDPGIAASGLESDLGQEPPQGPFRVGVRHEAVLASAHPGEGEEEDERLVHGAPSGCRVLANSLEGFEETRSGVVSDLGQGRVLRWRVGGTPARGRTTTCDDHSG